jgi:nucleoid DNA-binding protein
VPILVNVNVPTAGFGGAVNKSDLVRMAARRSSVTVPIADDVITTFLDLVARSLATEQTVHIRGFGKFEPRTRPPVRLKRPTDGTPIDVDSRRTAVFLPSMTMKRRLNDANPT